MITEASKGIDINAWKQKEAFKEIYLENKFIIVNSNYFLKKICQLIK